jgi:pilus assembly protein Flp/PilA
MNNLFLKLLIKFHSLKDLEDGQDMMEYALVVGLVSFGAIAGMRVLASGIQTSFAQISTTFNANV